MKKITLYIIAIVAAVFSMTSCKGFLVKEPVLSQSTELTLSSYEGLNAATLGAYSYIASDAWFGGVRNLTSDMRSGNGKKSLDHTSNRYNMELNWQCSSDNNMDASSIWDFGYLTIARANNVLDNLTEDKGSAKALNNLRAECLFLRALSHFEIVNLFAQPYSYAKTKEDVNKFGCPIILHTDPSDQSPRAKVTEVYDQIVKDLKDAEECIDPAYQRKGVADPKAVVSLDAIRALLSRVYLYMGDWNNCAAYATKVINSKSLKMWSASDYKEAWTNDAGSGEVIFEIYKDMSNLSNLDCCYMTYPDGAYGDCLCSDELYALYADGDVRKEMYVQDSDAHVGQYWTTKYAGKGINAPDANNVILLRLSEMYLNRAEAGVNGAAGCNPLDDINVITSNRGAAAYTSVGMADIKVERRKELAWEGHHFYDMARWGEPVNRTPDTFLNETNAKIDAHSYRWALPINKRELEVNHKLEQNPGF